MDDVEFAVGGFEDNPYDADPDDIPDEMDDPDYDPDFDD